MALKTTSQQDYLQIAVNIGAIQFETGGYHGTILPQDASPILWAPGYVAGQTTNNIYRLPTGALRRFRRADLVDSTITNWPNDPSDYVTSLFTYSDTQQRIVLADLGLHMMALAPTSDWSVIADRAHSFYGADVFPGPWSRVAINNVCYECNSLINYRAQGTGLSSNVTGGVIWNWGIYPPQDAPYVALSGSTPTYTVTATNNTSFGDRAVQCTVYITGVGTGAGGVDQFNWFFGGLSNEGTYPLTGTVPVPVDITGSAQTLYEVFPSTQSIGFAATFGATTGHTLGQAWVLTSAASGTSIVTPNTGAITSANLGAGVQNGRSYQYAFLNASALPRNHISAPSPATAYQIYSSEVGIIDAVEVGIVSGSGTSITGTGVAWDPNWIGMKVWVEGYGTQGFIAGLTGTAPNYTGMTLQASGSAFTNCRFKIYDKQATDVVWYATGNGGATFFEVLESAFDPTQTNIASAGLEYVDSNPNEPGQANASYNVAATPDYYNQPPPVFRAIKSYQGRIFGMGALQGTGNGADQTVYFSNVSLTVVGVLTDSFSPTNQITMPFGGAIPSAFGVTPTGLVIFSNQNHMLKITGTITDNNPGTDTFAVSSALVPLPYAVGCIGPRAEVEAPQGMFWLSPERQLWYWNDINAPVNIGLPIQNLLNTINLDEPLAPTSTVTTPTNPSGASVTVQGNMTVAGNTAQLVYHRVDQKEWIAIAFPTSSNTYNDTVVILDLNQFNPQQPNFYVSTGNQVSAIMSHSDPVLNRRLIAGLKGTLQDFDYNGSDYAIAESSSVANQLLLHALGNQNPFTIKEIKWLRFICNTDPVDMESAGWSFFVNGIDDDEYTFDSPLTLDLTPGTNSVASPSPFIISPGKFQIDNVNFCQGRRLMFGINFPTGPAAYELRQIQFSLRNIPPR